MTTQPTTIRLIEIINAEEIRLARKAVDQRTGRFTEQAAIEDAAVREVNQERINQLREQHGL